MKAVKHPGTCKICGEFKELTFEHIPPQKAFNSHKVTILPFEEVIKTLTCADGRMPWDTSGLKGTSKQGGYGKSCLCRTCNNNTGQWYMRAYTDFAKTLNVMIQQENISVGNMYSFVIKNVYPLRIFKAMMTLMCDINDNCFGDSDLRDFLMNKKSNNIDLSKYELYMYLVSTQMPRINGISGVFNIHDSTSGILVSDIASYPLGFALYLQKPENYIPFGLSLNDFAKYDYDTCCDVRFVGVPYLDINSQFPIDYRSKEDIIQCIEHSNEEINKYFSE